MNDAAGLTEVRVPDLGNFKDVAVIDVLVKPGERIAVDAPLITLETDKATMDVPSTAAGVVDRIHTSKGGKVNSGDLLITLKADGAQPAAGAQPTPTAAAPVAQRPATAAPATPPAAPPAAAQQSASAPAAARWAGGTAGGAADAACWPASACRASPDLTVTIRSPVLTLPPLLV